MSQCQNCGAATVPNQPKCTKCGSPIQVVPAANAGPPPVAHNPQLVHPSNPPKSSTTALILSCLIPGIGQIYLGQTIKGLVILIASFVIATATFGIGGIILWVVAMVDAHMIGNKLVSGNSVGQWEFF
jgi:TM2 domain-containing membrane protein YozV